MFAVILHYNMNWSRLCEICSSKENRITFLQNRGLLHNQRVCPEGHAMKLRLSDKEDRWRCQKGGCNTQFQLKSGTWLEGSHVAYKDIILFIYSFFLVI